MPRPPPLYLSRRPHPSSLPCFPPSSQASRHGRRLRPSFRAAPCSADELWSSTTPPSSSPPTELARGALSRRRSPPLPCRTRPRRHRNTPPPAHLRPSHHLQRAQGELLVLLDPFPLHLPRRSSLPGRLPPAPVSRSSWVIAQPTWPGWPGMWASGPTGQ
jgi:hypothetical protein